MIDENEFYIIALSGAFGKVIYIYKIKFIIQHSFKINKSKNRITKNEKI